MQEQHRRLTDECRLKVTVDPVTAVDAAWHPHDLKCGQ